MREPGRVGELELVPTLSQDVVGQVRWVDVAQRHRALRVGLNEQHRVFRLGHPEQLRGPHPRGQRRIREQGRALGDGAQRNGGASLKPAQAQRAPHSGDEAEDLAVAIEDDDVEAGAVGRRQRVDAVVGRAHERDGGGIEFRGVKRGVTRHLDHGGVWFPGCDDARDRRDDGRDVA